MSIDNPVEGQTPALQRAGDCVLPLSESACAGLVSLHGPMVKAACQRILRDATLAEDVAQEVFLLLVRKLPSLPDETVLGGWLYVTACNLARTHQRTEIRRSQRENRPEAVEQLMTTPEGNSWRELEPLLDDAMLTLTPRQRELVLSHYFQKNTQRAAARFVGCSESVASRELASAIENLRKVFSRKGVTVSGAGLMVLLTAHGAQATMGAATLASTLSSASAIAGTAAAGTPLLLSLMKTTATTKTIAAIAAILITLGIVQYYARTDSSTHERNPGVSSPTVGAVPRHSSPAPEAGKAPARLVQPAVRREAASLAAVTPVVYDAAALKAAHEKERKFWDRMDQLALMSDPLKVQEILNSEYGIRLTEEEIRKLQAAGQKPFKFGVPDLWATKQPAEALAWATSVLSENDGQGGLHGHFLEAAAKALPNLDRNALAAMLPEGPARLLMLDLADAHLDPLSLANRILAVTDPEERAARLKILAEGWSNPEQSVEWARQNLSGADRTAFYVQAAYNLAHQNQDAALQALTELQGTDVYASTLMTMMRGLVQVGGRGQQVADMIASSDFDATQRAQVISELARRWVRQDADATVAWVNSLTAPEDFRAAIPLLVSQLDNERVG